MRALLLSSLLLLAGASWAQAPDSQPTAPPPASQPVQSYEAPAPRRAAIVVDRVLFSKGSASIAAEDFVVLDEIAAALNARPDIVLFEVQGHADPTTEGLYADKISLKRANAVKAYLVSQGVDPERLEARGYGGRLPLTNGQKSKDRAKNRRIEFQVLKKAE